jgi:hypothetical protein
MSKQSQANEIFTKNTGSTRKELIEKFMSELNVSKAHASTMYQTAKKKNESGDVVIGEAPFVVFDKDTTIYTIDNRFKTLAAARSAITRLANKGTDVSNVQVAGIAHFRQNIEKTHMVTNARFGGEVEESVNTPFSCSVASDHYWQS